jgi:hypothetical protein
MRIDDNELSGEYRGLLHRVNEKLDLIITNQETIMSQDQDLNNAVSSLASGFTALDTAVQAELAAVSALIAADGPALQTAVTQAVANISTMTAAMAADAAALTASVPAATTVPPPPPPPPPPVPATSTTPVLSKVKVTAPTAKPPQK